MLREPQIVQKAGVQIANTEQEETGEISMNQTVPAFFFKYKSTDFIKKIWTPHETISHQIKSNIIYQCLFTS